MADPAVTEDPIRRRGRPKVEHPRTTRIVVRVTREEAAAIAVMAERDGSTISNYIRRLVLG